MYGAHDCKRERTVLVSKAKNLTETDTCLMLDDIHIQYLTSETSYKHTMYQQDDLRHMFKGLFGRASPGSDSLL